MATGDRKANIFINRLLSKTAMREQLLEYLSDKLDDTISAFFQGGQGTLDDEKIGLAADGNDRFRLDLTNANKVGVATGQFIVIPDENDVSKFIKFENAAAVPYHVGVRYNEVVWDEVDTNPKYGNAEYPSIMDSLGELGAPDSVANTPGVKIALNINGLTESGVDHSGRTVKVWLTVPVSGVQAIAFFEGVSYYSAPNNFVDIPYSGANGPLGQDTGSNPPSTTAGDYRCFIKGVTWRRNTDLSLDPTYAYLGTVTGGGAGNPPSSTDISAQTLLYLLTLDRAYDGPSTVPGFGRAINLDAGAVELNTGTGTTGDDSYAQLRLNRLNSVEYAQFMLTMLTGDISEIPLAILQPMQWAEMTFDEPVNQSGTQRLDFTRVGAIPNAAGLRISNRHHLVYLEDSPEKGLYGISAVGATYIDVVDLKTGAAPSAWTTGSGRKANVLVPRVVFADEAPFNAAGYGDWEGFLFNLRNGNNGNTPIKLLLENLSGTGLEIWNNEEPPRLAAKIANEWIAGSEYQPVLQLGDDDVGGGFSPLPFGLRVYGHPDQKADVTAVNIHSGPLIQLNDHQPFHRALAFHNERGEEHQRWEMWGRHARHSIFEDDLFYLSMPADKYTVSGSGASTWSGGDPSTVKSNGGTVYMYSGNIFGDYRLMQGPASLYLLHSDDSGGTDQRIIYFASRFRLHTWNTEISLRLGLANQAGAEINLAYDAAGSPSTFKLHAYDNVATHNYSSGVGTPPLGELINNDGWVFFEFRVKLSDGTALIGITTDTTIEPVTIPNPTHANWRGLFSPYIYIATTEAQYKRVELDYWAMWDAVIKGGPKDKNS